MAGGQLVGAAFDYAALPVDLADEARQTAGRIRLRHQQHVAAIIETGRDLLSIKDRLGHGNFGPWLEAEFGWNERTARRYMMAATEFGDKTDIVSDLPPTALYKLAAPSTPEPIREEVIQRLEAGERLGLKEVEDRLWLAREADKKAREEARLTPRQRTYRKKVKQKADEEHAKLQEEGRRRRAQIEVAVLFLQERLGGELSDFIALLDKISPYEFVAALREAGVQSHQDEAA